MGNTYNIEYIFIVNLICNILCLVFGVLLLDMRRFKLFIIRRPKVYPTRYVFARSILGLTYLLLGGTTLLQTLGYIPISSQKNIFFWELINYSLQIQLFTGAFLALYNSRYITLKRIFIYLIPPFLFIIIFIIFGKTGYSQRLIANIFIGYYTLQLIVYSIIFIKERRIYLDAIDWYYGDGPRYKIFRLAGVKWLFIFNILLGASAIICFIITQSISSLPFVISYTVYCVITAWYFIDRAWTSQKIQDITTPENWKKTEDLKTKL